MPTYDYVCHHCGHRFEVIHGVHAEGPSHCPVCHRGPVRKAFSAPSIVFKGSGWAKKDRSATSKPAATKAADATSGSSKSDDGSKAATTATASDSSSPGSSSPSGAAAD